MAIEITYDKQTKVILAQVSDYLEFEDIEYFMSVVLSSKEIPSGANTIWDITQMKFDNIDIELQKKIVEMRKNFNIERGNARIALVSNYPLGDVIVKLFLILMKEISQETMSFKTRELAMDWFAQA